jgi:hypothetical protein
MIITAKRSSLIVKALIEEVVTRLLPHLLRLVKTLKRYLFFVSNLLLQFFGFCGIILL